MKPMRIITLFLTLTIYCAPSFSTESIVELYKKQTEKRAIDELKHQEIKLAHEREKYTRVDRKFNEAISTNKNYKSLQSPLKSRKILLESITEVSEYIQCNSNGIITLYFDEAARALYSVEFMEFLDHVFIRNFKKIGPVESMRWRNSKNQSHELIKLESGEYQMYYENSQKEVIKQRCAVGRLPDIYLKNMQILNSKNALHFCSFNDDIGRSELSNAITVSPVGIPLHEALKYSSEVEVKLALNGRPIHIATIQSSGNELIDKAHRLYATRIQCLVEEGPHTENSLHFKTPIEGYFPN